MRKWLPACLCLQFLIPGAFIGAQANEARVESFRLNENMYRLVLNDIVNIVVFSGPDGVLLVDSGFDGNPVFGFVHSPAAVKAELKKIASDRVRYIIDTHTDLDHAYGNGELGPEATIITHQLGRERLLRVNQFPSAGLPSLTFSDSLQLFFNGEEIDLFYLPGHTNHDIAVHFRKAKIVCVGDLIIPDSFGSISPSGNATLLIKAIDFLYRNFGDDVLFIAGHDRPLQRKELLVYREMVEKTLAIVVKAIKQNQSLEAMKKNDILRDWKSWNGVLFKELDADGWIEMLYMSMIRTLKPSAAKRLGELLAGADADAAKPGIRRLLAARSAYYFLEREFNQLGYNLLNEGKPAAAIEVFKITVGLYPGSWNAYDSLGEAYAIGGNKELAIENYEKSLKLNPDSRSGGDALRQLREGK
jgi:cyclase